MSITNKQWFGLPLHLLWGYIAIAVFMTGDGFELAFLSHYIKELGFSPAQASFAFTLYGLAAALSAWVSGVVAEIITPQKTMFIGFVLWCVFHVLFLVFGLGHANYPLILLFYGIRGFAYPLFLYSFIVVIIHNVKSENASSALGWYWAVYSIGIGVAGSYIPSFTIPLVGELGTLWMALFFCLAGGLIAMISLRKVQTPTHMHNLTTKEKFNELGRAITLLYTNRSIMYSSMVRIINTLSLFGFAVIMPLMFVDELGFTTSEWLQIWAAFFFTTIFSNIFWGIVAEKLGWMRVVRWFGCLGMAASSLAFYYVPQYFGHNFGMALIPAIALGIFVAAFVPMAAVFPALEPRHKGAAISVYNLSAGLSNFLAPAIAVVLLPYFSTIGVVIAYTTLYIIAFFLCHFIRVEQPGFESAVRVADDVTVRAS
ncbi:MFS family ribitol/xylitol/arabitol transporter [Buttiauxella gaviniae ATCC 51604]|uniref:MFS family ribitol/xylitol/arabitol transporter n=2 Tax=Buttiauxella TaxID=82976 RepID=A0A1B7INE4_9ENTR|nr:MULTISPECIES: RbtT/DalT/CsbX family MFS transporter [Buttiauxella]OAT23197.1 MFS family ribitol/xylitol/arabitol transporter [Buttiauxella gaviniae ATCC 51604]OAT31198.1 MFS family ribitol/xylitol/arabitol transporter [Buttiauxella brennerae ATCC 51605]TDX16716.1 polyol permease family [Buttiauxella sp. BIGb0552]